MVVKTCSHLSDDVNLAFFMVRARKGALLLKNSSMRYALKFTIPKNDLTFVRVVGLAALSKAIVQSWVCATPFAEKKTPDNSFFGMLKMYF